MAKTLFLHIGHGKTGSSFLQALLANNRDWLRREYSLYYPPENTSHAESGMISSGNGNILTVSAAKNAWQDAAFMDEGLDLLLSSEMLFHDFSNWVNSPILSPKQPFDRIKILLFIRNPLELIGSNYQQVVKRRGYTEDVDTYTKNFRFFAHLEEVIRRLKELPHVDLMISNYSRKKDDIQSVLQDFLSIQPFPNAPFLRVNRSLTYAELILIRSMNRKLGRRAQVVADALCNNHRNLRSDVIIPSRGAWETFLGREHGFIEEVNGMCPLAEKLTAEYSPVDEATWSKTIGMGQIGTIGRVIGDLISQETSAKEQ